MTSSGTVLSTAVAVAAGAAAGGALAPVTRRRRYLPGALAEHDPDASDPLRRPLRYGVAGLLLPVWPGRGDVLYVGRSAPRRPDPTGADTLRHGVLGPLLRRVAVTGGHVYPGRREPFELLVELPGDEAAPGAALRSYHLLDACLRDHAAMLTRWSPAGAVPGPVTVTVTGRLSVLPLLAGHAERRACVEGTLDDIGSATAPPALAPLLSEHWSWRFGWDGRGPMPPEERHQLHALVRDAHAEGRRVRFLGVPDRPARVRRAFWAELSAAGVDFISSRDLRALAWHLRRRPVVPPEEAAEPGTVSPVTGLPPAAAGVLPGARVRPPTPPRVTVGSATPHRLSAKVERQVNAT